MEQGWLQGALISSKVYVDNRYELIMTLVDYYQVNLELLEVELSYSIEIRKIDLALYEDLVVKHLLDELRYYNNWVNKHDITQEKATGILSAHTLAVNVARATYKDIRRINNKRIDENKLNNLSYDKDAIETTPSGIQDKVDFAISALQDNPKRLYRRKDSANNAIKWLTGKSISKYTKQRVINSLLGTLDYQEPPNDELDYFKEAFKEDSHRFY